MSSVTQRIAMVQQPWGGYVKPTSFEKIVYDDGTILNEDENVTGSLVGTAVDYLTRSMIGNDPKVAFSTPLSGAAMAFALGGEKKALDVALEFLDGIKGIDKQSVISACKLVSFDVWYRNPLAAKNVKGYRDINPNDDTIQNIQTLVKRGITFFENYGPVTKSMFGFTPKDCSKDDIVEWKKNKNCNFGGYTPTVDSGDGDFLTKDTLWDFKVLRSRIKSTHTLQLLTYWIMGQHSGQTIYQNIKRIGLFNPRFNTVYLLDVNRVSHDIIAEVENNVICYQ